MAQAATTCLCNHSGCYCKGYIIPTSKWSKGKCKNCNHSEKEHGEVVPDVSFDSTAVVAAPQGTSKWDSQIDANMGIAPSGKTNYKPENNAPSIYDIHLDESDWINWSADDLLVWLQQKKRFPEEIRLKSIEHEMRKQNVNGSKITQLTHSTLLSYGFTEYDHRTRLLTEVKTLLDYHPSASQKPTYDANQSNQQDKKQNVNKNEDQKQQEPKENKEESVLLKEANLIEAEWRTWSVDQVWEWLKVKQGWVDYESMEYLFVHKLNEYEEKLKSNDIQLSGAKLEEVQQDIKTQTLLKGIGFPFSLRKKVYKYIDVLIRHNSN